METKAYYCNSRYYSPELCRFISPNSIDYLDPENINGLNLYSYANNNPIGITHSGFSAGFSASGGMVSTLSLGGSRSGVSSSSGSNVNVSASAWMQTLVGAVPDIILGIRYLNAKGIHTIKLKIDICFQLWGKLGVGLHNLAHTYQILVL